MLTTNLSKSVPAARSVSTMTMTSPLPFAAHDDDNAKRERAAVVERVRRSKCPPSPPGVSTKRAIGRRRLLRPKEEVAAHRQADGEGGAPDDERPLRRLRFERDRQAPIVVVVERDLDALVLLARAADADDMLAVVERPGPR